MRAIVYNAKTREAKEVEIENYKDYYKHLDCRTFDIVRISESVNVYVDDEGLMVDNPSFSLVAGYPEPLAGNLVFTGGADRDGNTLSSTESVKNVIKNIIAL